MKRLGMVFRKFELNAYRRSIWAWFELYLTPKRYNLKISCCSAREPTRVVRI